MKHLKVLEDAGLIRQERHSQWRPLWLDAWPLEPAAAWFDAYRRFWGGSFDSLAAHLGETAAWQPPALRSGAWRGDADVRQQRRGAYHHGSMFRMSRSEMLDDWAIPQFYFHLVTIYAILRNKGVDLGIRDYLGHKRRHLVSGEDASPDARAGS